MWTNYLKIAFRNLRRHPISGSINLIGLALSLAVGLLIVTFIWHQFQYDQFHEDKDRIVRVLTERRGDRVATTAEAPGPMASLLKQSAPEVEEVVRLSRFVGSLVPKEKALSVEGLFVEEEFFDVFGFTLAQGNPRTALAKPHSLVLTQETAAELFGDAEVVGKVLPVESYHAGYDTTSAFTVTGVLEESPGPSHLTFEALVPFSTLRALGRDRRALEAWDTLWYPTYVLLREGASGSSLDDNFSSMVRTHYPASDIDSEEISFHTQALTDVNPGPFYGSRVEFEMVPWVVIYFLGGLGAVLLLVAGFNYVGLSVARTLERTTEIGVRKSLGARRSQVASQFIVEAVLFALLALVGAYALLTYLVPAFNSLQFVGELNWEITSSLYDPGLLGVCILFSVVVGVLAGLYPALWFSSFPPVRILRGGVQNERNGRGTLSLRRVLIIAQFALAFIFIVSGVQLFRQYDFMATDRFGMETENIINVRLQGESYETFRGELLRHPSIEGVSAAARLPPSGWTRTTHVSVPQGGGSVTAMMNSIDPHFIENMGLQMVAGAQFSGSSGRTVGEPVIINERAARALGYTTSREAVGKIVFVEHLQPGDAHVIGVVEDHPFEDATEPIRPLVLRHVTDHFSYLNVRVAPGRYEAATAAIEETWEAFNSPYPIQYERYEAQISGDRMALFFHALAWVVGFIALLIIVVATMGLLGMVAYATQTRVKEIGIRKALGASVVDIVVHLSREFLVLIGIAVLTALPVGWYANVLWLQEFARRIEFTWWVLGGSIASVLIVALLVVGAQTVKTALADPAESLRDE